MRPLSVLIGIIMGSAIALTVSLTMSGIVFLLLPEYYGRLASERLPLLRGLLWSWGLAAVSVTCFVGELRGRRWRFGPEVLLAVMIAVLLYNYWP
jgi:VIT1/CCC1 family predicted Fe2+/Mn2+ transporter